MIFEIKGIGFPNKGAELMLIAIKQQLTSRFPDSKYVAEPTSDYKSRAMHGLYQKFWQELFGIQIGSLGSLIPKKIRQKYGLILDKEIDVIIDASGFAYGDQWGASKAKKRLAKYIVKWKKDGKTIILLPQAFGPFESKYLSDHMQTIVTKADLTCPRDNISLSYLKNYQGNIMEFPDFTNLVEGKVPRGFIQTDNDVCIIPNSKMIEMTSDDVAYNYSQQITDIILEFNRRGMRVYLLIHEGIRDRNLALEIKSKTGLDIPIYDNFNSLEIKGIIGTAKIVVSSRFHGLVSALSQGVPAIATGWSHKYEMLMKDYDCSELLITSKEHDAIEAIEKLTTIDSYIKIKQKVTLKSKELKKKSVLMWQEVFKVIDGEKE